MIYLKKILYSTLIISFLILSISNNILSQDRSISKLPEPTSARKCNLKDHSGKSSLSNASVNRHGQIKKVTDNHLEKYNRNTKSGENDFYNNRREINYSNKEITTGNYFYIDKSGKTLWDGKHWDISSFPLKVYIKESSSSYYKSLYKDYVNYALNVWKNADDRINYTFVNSNSSADISVIFEENLGKKYNEDYLGLTEYNIDENKRINYSKIQISLIKFDDEVVTDGEIKGTLIHEFGHAFGLGHSENELDIMYPYIDPDQTPLMNYVELSNNDREAIGNVIDLGKKHLSVKKQLSLY